ncbi:MAG TPA: ATP-binding protein, partial [Candidatus Wallbacteria bacterium]|nr:ATP-binding protein [Candidatus Wallbacteria bacterium]
TSVYIDENIGGSLTGDYKKLRQILLNLVSNAIKFTKNGEVKIEIKLCCYKNDKTFVTFNVIDNGIGMSSEQVEKIFKPFDQARPEISRIYGGTGLGLHISNQLVKLLNGEKISVESAIDKGSKFYFTLPFTAKPETASGSKASPVFKIEKNIASYEILIVEDNLINYILVEELLKKMGHRPHKAEDGLKAVELVKKNRYDIIFMDIQMPGIDGYEATRQIRMTDREVPIVAMTANAIRGDYERCIESGMNDYLSKPIEIEKFNDIILRYVKNAARQSLAPDLPVLPGSSVICAQNGAAAGDSDSVSIFDREKFVKNTFSNDSLAKDIIKIFFEDIEKYRSIINNAIERKEPETLFKSAHRLKGSAANVCAPRLKQAFLNLETAGRESRFEDAVGLFELLGRELDIFKAEIKKCGYNCNAD